MIDFIWNLEDDPDGNLQHISEHGISREEVEDVLRHPRNLTGVSESSGRLDNHRTLYRRDLGARRG